MGQSTIEFSTLPDDTDPHVRHFFRVPVHEEKHGGILFISDVGYRISEISRTGIGVVVENNQTFEIGEYLEPCRVQLDELVLTGLTGKIVHCSSHEDVWKFGIQWIDMTKDHKQQMEALHSRLKKRVMASSQPFVPKDTGREK